jgi:hypothetical protein
MCVNARQQKYKFIKRGDRKVSDLPDKIQRIDILRIEHNMRKLCACLHHSYVIDTENKLVYCKHCGAIIDPFEALCELARDVEHWNNQTEMMLKQQKEIQNWKPWLLPLRKVEKLYRAGQLLPMCPHCGRGILAEELAMSAINKKIELEQRKKEKEAANERI